MKKLISSCVLLLLLSVGFAQNPDFSKIKFWTGSGSKVAMLIIDFNDGSAIESYAWGYRFSGDNITAQNMLNDIVANDTNLSIVLNGGFLSDINYLSHSGVGDSPYYWSTFTLIHNLWGTNSGYSEVLSDSMIFGNSYTDVDASYNPITSPENPDPASKPFVLNTENIAFWTGTGSKSAYLVVDFNDDTNPQCFTWGYRFDADTITAEQMMNEIAIDDYHITVNLDGGFLNDIIYFNHSGIGGNPYYWSSFTLTNFIWVTNWGISETLQNNTVIGLSYTDVDEDYNPLLEPEDATPADLHTNIVRNTKNRISIYPNPAIDFINFNTDEKNSVVKVLNLTGEIVFQTTTNLFAKNQINISSLAKGSYILQIENKGYKTQELFIKE